MNGPSTDQVTLEATAMELQGAILGCVVRSRIRLHRAFGDLRHA